MTGRNYERARARERGRRSAREDLIGEATLRGGRPPARRLIVREIKCACGHSACVPAPKSQARFRCRQCAASLEC